MDVLRRSDFEIRPVPMDVGRELVEAHHYARGGSNTAVYMHGLFRSGAFWDSECMGVAWWIPPTRSAAEASWDGDWKAVLALSRLVLTPAAPHNAATFLMMGSVRLIDRKRWRCLVTYADQWRGHTGGIYRAAGWEYMGLTKPERTYTVAGVMTARKAGGKTRTGSQMIALGAQMVGSHAKHKFRLVFKENGKRLTTPPRAGNERG